MNVSWSPDFPEPGGSPDLLNSYVYFLNCSSIFRNVATEVGEVSHFPYCFVFQYDCIIRFIKSNIILQKHTLYAKHKSAERRLRTLI
jgi:hypothetical protein